MDGTVLVADDDRTIRTVLTQALTRSGCKVHATSSLTTLMRWVAEGKGDTIITDVMMPDGNGLEMLPKIASDRPGLPVIVISAQNTIMTAIQAADAKAFDYLPKPFEPKELLLRIINILNKTKKSDFKRVIQFENIKIDLNKQLIFKNKNEYKINNTEKIILEKMINNPGKTFERMEIGRLIDIDKERSVDVIITRLRKKIELDPKNPKFLQTIRGAGYVLWIE